MKLMIKRGSKLSIGGIAFMFNVSQKSSFGMILSRMVAIVLAFIVLFSAVKPASAIGTGFSDVPENYTHYQNIMNAKELGFISGYPDGTFKPLQELTRANVVKILGKYALATTGSTLATYDVSGVKPFNDASKNYPDQELVKYSLIVRKEGIFNGDPNNNLKPDSLMSRQQIAQVMVNAFDLKDVPGNESNVKDNDKAMDDAYRNAINILSKNGVTNVENFRPAEFTNRGQLASFLMRSYKVDQNKVVDLPSMGDYHIKRGDRVELPGTLIAKHKNGLTSEVKVNWNTGNFDENVVGTYKVVGEIEGTTVTITVKVVVNRLSKIAPTFDYNGESLLTIKYDSELTLPLITATDSFGEAVFVNQVILLNNEVVSAVDTNKPGNYVVKYDAQDKDGNYAESLVINVIVLEEDLIGPKIKTAELAIAALPSIDQLTLDHQVVVNQARNLVNEVLEIDNNATIKGIEKLIEMELAIERLVAKKTLADMIQAAEETIATLPAIEVLTNNDRVFVERARNLVNRINKLDSSAVIEGMSKLIAAEEKMEELYVPTMIFPTQSTSLINDSYKSISIGIMNTSTVTLSVEKIELIENNRVRNTYTKEQLETSGIATSLAPGEKTNLSITFNFGGPSKLNINQFKVYASDGKKVHGYVYTVK